MGFWVKGMSWTIVAMYLIPVKEPADTARNLQNMFRVLEFHQTNGTPIIIGADFNFDQKSWPTVARG